MAADDRPDTADPRPTISQAQMPVGSTNEDAADETLADFAFRWSQELEAATDPDGRTERHQLAGGAAIRAIDAGDLAAWDFVRTWLRRLADDVQRDRLSSPTPAPLERAAQQVVRLLLQHERDSVAALREATAASQDPLELVRRAPRNAGVLRELGRVAALFRGSGC